MQENVIKCSKSKNNSLSDLGSFIKHHFGVNRLFFFYKKICFIWKMCCLFSPMLLHNAQMKYFKLNPLLFSLKTVYVKCSWWFAVISVKPAKTSTSLSQNNVVSGFQLLTVTWNRMQRGRQGSRCASHLGCAAGGRPPPQCRAWHLPVCSCTGSHSPISPVKMPLMALSTTPSFVSAPPSRSPMQMWNGIGPITNGGALAMTGLQPHMVPLTTAL